MQMMTVKLTLTCILSHASVTTLFIVVLCVLFLYLLISVSSILDFNIPPIYKYEYNVNPKIAMRHPFKPYSCSLQRPVHVFFQPEA